MNANSKEWLQYGTAVTMVLSGIALTFICFFTKDDVTEGVLWYMAQALTFAGAIFGVNIYFHTKIGQAENRMKQYVQEKLRKQTQESNENNQ